ncbi:type I restriction endonuclease subunit R [Flaviaesturariibacter aridisoli]|uniref:Type I restriction enzyme endonuclease subunit n=1 Tax=Flaviaesturariibacter aridisoli TaxID=2545761 RepID=A0A4V2WMX9_9BACT|nr:type I restriction endonuclease subunit R [Flaviaesturariibacter aridisoli]TCZ73282.1 type I restriction endonuclease subunit R [Flaviaesturariibacter aridisoli]
MSSISEDHIERWVIEALSKDGFKYLTPESIDPDVAGSLRTSYQELLLKDRLQQAVVAHNPTIPITAIQQAIKEVERVNAHGDLVSCNAYFQKLLTEGVDVTFMEKGEERTQKVWLVDIHNPGKNDWVVTHQMTIIENGQNKRPDVLIFLNGIPVVVMELKNATDPNATIDKAYQQLQTYHAAIPSLFHYNLLEIISDGLEAKVGTITSDISRFLSWKTADGKTTADRKTSELQVMMEGLLNPGTLLDMFLNFIVFEQYKYEDLKTKTIQIGTMKKVAAYHQYYAVKKAVLSAQRASSEAGNKKGGVVWHTQGSGKSLSMVFFTGLLVKHLNNPTIVVITDRNDLDDQLFETFANCKQLLRQVPVQIESRAALVKELKQRQSGGIFFTTIQKFLPEEGNSQFELLSDRRNIIVIADEAHRTQYGFEAKVRTYKDDQGKEIGSEVSYGFAKHMHDALPAATFVGFTGTPVEAADKNTKAVFGEYVDIYDIERAVRDGATVPIFYENRFAKLKLDQFFVEELDDRLSHVAEGLPEYIVKQSVEKATRMEAIVGNQERMEAVALDIITHFEDRTETLKGKALVVAMSRNVAVKLYNEMVSLRPDWHSEDDTAGNLKVIMTGSSSDDAFLQPHIRNKEGRSRIAARLKEPNDPLQMVIVVDMWLTGFDAPVLHTLYLDKDMSGHNLMQAIARVNRVFGSKPGGLVVDYVPVTGNLKAALKVYTESQGKGNIAADISEAVAFMLTKLEVVQQMYHGFEYPEYFTSPVGRKMNIILEAEDHILSLENGKERYLKEVTALSKAYALSKAEPAAKEITEEVAFFQAVRARLAKFDTQVTGQRRKEFEGTVRNLVEAAVAADGIVNLLDQAGLEKPEISIFSDEFMDEVRNMKQRNVAVELLKKLLSDQIKIRFKRNIVATKNFSEKLTEAINRYNRKAITALEMIELLLEISGEVNKETERGQDLGLTETEKAFYDALRVNKSALELIGDEKLMIIARELVSRVKRSTTLDWTVRQSAKDRVKLEVKRVLRFHKYPPDDEPRATETVLEQAELHAADLV